MSMYIYTYKDLHWCVYRYGTATMTSLPKLLGLFCKRALYKRRYSSKDIISLIDPTDRNHPMARRALSYSLFFIVQS